MAQFLSIDSKYEWIQIILVEGNFEPKLEQNGTTKKIWKDMKSSNYNPSDYIKNYIMQIIWKIKLKLKLKSYILSTKQKTYGGIAQRHNINFGPKSNHIALLKKM